MTYISQRENLYANVIEDDQYLQLFLQYPPVDFKANIEKDIIFFLTNFNLFTTMEPKTFSKIQKLPLFHYWSKLFILQTCFIGTTITEYTPLPKRLKPADLLNYVAEKPGKEQTLTIIKDLPVNSPLLSNEDNIAARKLTDAAIKNGFLELSGQALAYVPIDFESMDEYLGRLSASRRKDLRRKMKSTDQLHIETYKLGDKYFSDDKIIDEFYSMYIEVFNQSEIHFDLLSKEFFAALLRSESIEGIVVLYKCEAVPACYNICLLSNGMLIDKYIGFRYPLARQFNLYFVSWLYNLELAQKYDCKYYIAGWTDPEVKASLGASFTFTSHLVWIKNPLFRKILQPLKSFFEADRKVVDGL